ncbi:MAG: FAD-binding protein [Bacteroidales bacterium]|nr:FAD-binding protein [Candidatus Cacconaster merdequi]
MIYDAIIIGGGRSGLAKGIELQGGGVRCLIFSTGEGAGRFRDPSYDHKSLVRRFEALGGTYVMGDTVTGGVFSEDGSLLSIHTANQGDTSFSAARYYIATGSFFSKGLVADKDRIYEPLFNLDVDAPAAREEWVNPDFFADQPFMHFGVTVDDDGCPCRGGKSVKNLFAIGSILGDGSRK